MVEINWTHEAQTWLRDIYNYIATDNQDAAHHTILGILDKAELLKTYPRLGHRYELEGVREVRVLLYEHYRIAYLVKPDESIDVLGVFHGALSIERYLV